MKKSKIKRAKQEKSSQHNQKKFDAQVNCVCQKGCATHIDVMRQMHIFEEFNKLETWPKQTLFIRSLIVMNPVKENLNPIIVHRKKENVYNYHFIDEKGSLTQVCSSFFVKVLQIKRKQVFRAMSSMKTNPNAIERRGSSRSSKNACLNKQYLKEFIDKFVTYENRHSSVKYLHPRLNIRKMYQFYQENCVFRKRNILSEAVFRCVFKSKFEFSFVRRTKSNCDVCQMKKIHPRNSTPNSDVIEALRTKQNMLITAVMDIKNELIESVKHAREAEEKEEVLTFERQMH